MVKDDCKQRDLTDLDIHQATDMTPIRCLVTVEVSPVIYDWASFSMEEPSDW